MTDSPQADHVRELCVLALDHGEKRIGLAIKPAGQNWALPLSIIQVRSETQAMEEIRSVIRDRAVRVVVVGLPINADPHQAQKVKRFARKLREGISGVRWRFQDETLTSAEAEEALREARAGVRGKPSDDLAAKLILESFLQTLQKQ